MADPGFLQGGADLVGGGGPGLPKQLRFEHFVCQNKRIWTTGFNSLNLPNQVVIGEVSLTTLKNRTNNFTDYSDLNHGLTTRAI